MKHYTQVIINDYLMHLWCLIGIDKPSNHDEIVEFVIEDTKASADNRNWHSGDIDIAFRRFLESKSTPS